MNVIILVLLIASAICALLASFGRWVDAPHTGYRPSLGWLALALFVIAQTFIFVGSSF